MNGLDRKNLSWRMVGQWQMVILSLCIFIAMGCTQNEPTTNSLENAMSESDTPVEETQTNPAPAVSKPAANQVEVK